MRRYLDIKRQIFLVLSCVLIFSLPACKEEQIPEGYEKLVIQTQEGKQHVFHVEVAETPQALQQGLMYRQEMPANQGMLFIFQLIQNHNFWMKNTFIPLDMLFIRENGVIHHIHENAVPHDLTPVPSNGAVKSVLEINGGVAAKLGLKPGDMVIHNAFGN